MNLIEANVEFRGKCMQALGMVTAYVGTVSPSRLEELATLRGFTSWEDTVDHASKALDRASEKPEGTKN